MEIDQISNIVIFLCLAYIIGSIPTGYLIVKIITGKDLREIGSGSTGATNVKRVLGTRYFFYVMFLDFMKGFVPVLYTAWYSDFPYRWGEVIVSILLLLGHTKSVFLNFKGGKAVATCVGTLFAMNWIVGLIVAIVWGLVTWFSKYVSLGSIVAVIVAPIAMLLLHARAPYVIYTLLVAIYVIYLHRDNIKRLLNHTENKVRE